jgi:hypothetical protein
VNHKFLDDKLSHQGTRSWVESLARELSWSCERSTRYWGKTIHLLSAVTMLIFISGVWCCTYLDALLFPVREQPIQSELSTHSLYFVRLRVQEQHFSP